MRTNVKKWVEVNLEQICKKKWAKELKKTLRYSYIKLNKCIQVICNNTDVNINKCNNNDGNNDHNNGVKINAIIMIIIMKLK